MGRHAEAERLYEAAVGLMPADEQPSSRSVGVQIGPLKLLLAPVGNPDLVRTLANLGDVRLELGKTEAALDAWERAARHSGYQMQWRTGANIQV